MMTKMRILVLLFCSVVASAGVPDVVVLTVGVGPSEAQSRFFRSASIYKYNVKVLGDNSGPVSDAVKLQLLKEAVAAEATERQDTIVLYVDGPNVVLTAGPLRLVEELTRDAEGVGGPMKVLVAADGVCWPDKQLAKLFPKVERGRRYLDSGGIVGTAAAFHKLLESVVEETSLQDLLTQRYLKPSQRRKYDLQIDHTSTLFQNLQGATGELEVRFAGREAYLQNTAHATVPLVVRGNRNTDVTLSNYANYLARSWTQEDGCRECWENMLNLEKLPVEEYPVLLLALFVPSAAPFFEEFLQKVTDQIYPKNRMHLYVHNMMEFHEEALGAWIEGPGREYLSIRYIDVQANAKLWHTKNKASEYCVEQNCDFVMHVDALSHLDNPYAFKLLVEQNRMMVAPVLGRPHKAWSNFWGALTSDGFYARSTDYVDIVQNNRRGLWNVPYVGNSYLISRELIDDPARKPNFIHKLMDPDMAMCHNFREQGVFMFVSNRLDLGHLVSNENFVSSHYIPEMWQVSENRWDWENRYLHENFSQGLAENSTIAMPCPDVYWLPLFKERYAKDMIDVMENYGQWSDGSHSDKRLDGGYETVPTVDIHMNQIAYKDEWMEILRAYVQPLQQRVYEGYFNDVGPPQALMAFVVRYKPDEQPFLRPHHDTSTYTINVALNRPEIDYQGGGCRFVRYNCSVTNTRVGWMLMHPGRLTHLHEGLYTTGGTRYIVITFIDP